MSKVPRISILLATGVTSLAFCAGAGAAPVIVGSPLTGAFVPAGDGSLEGTLFNSFLGEPGAHVTSPVSGAIVRWHLLGAEGSPFRLRVLQPEGGSAFMAVGSSAPARATGSGLEAFATDLPIQAGETVGLDIPKEIKLGIFSPAPRSGVDVWLPQLPEGASLSATESEAGGEYGFNAEVQPQPTVTLVSPAASSPAGGSVVTIAGTDFSGVSAVKFGANAARSYTVGSEGEISAVAPPGAIGVTDVTVTTLAGTSPVVAGDKFTYAAPAPTCTVPKLKGKKLKAAKKSLTKAACKLGKLKVLKGATAKTGKVVKQSPKAGRVVATGTKVSVGLG